MGDWGSWELTSVTKFPISGLPHSNPPSISIHKTTSWPLPGKDPWNFNVSTLTSGISAARRWESDETPVPPTSKNSRVFPGSSGFARAKTSAIPGTFGTIAIREKPGLTGTFGKLGRNFTGGGGDWEKLSRPVDPRSSDVGGEFASTVPQTCPMDERGNS